MITVEKNIESDKFAVQVIEKQIIENIIKVSADLDVDDVIKLKKVNESLMNGEKYVILVNSLEYSTISNEARNLVASKEFAKDTIAKALLISNFPHRLVANFYIKFNKPFITTKIFTDRTKAMKWLREQLKQKNV